MGECSTLPNIKEKAEELIEKIKGEKVGVIVHRHADPDAVASASPFMIMFSAKGYAPQGLSAQGKRVAEHLGLEFLQKEPEEDVLIIVDTASSSQLPGISLEGKDYLRIDHHAEGDLRPFMVYPQASSTSEIVALAFRSLGLELPKAVAEALMAGIIYDSKVFRLAKPSTFTAMEYLSRYGSVSKAFSILGEQREEDISVKIAKVKACERLVHRKVKDFVIGVTEIGAHESSVAKALLSMGLDVAFVVREEKDEVRVYARASPRAQKYLDLAKFLSELAEELGGKGGGHRGAAGAILPKVEYEKLVNKLLGRASRRLVEAMRSESGTDR